MNYRVKSLYIHFPFCRHLCNYCDFHKTVLENNDEIVRFEQIFADQWQKLEKLFKENSFTMKELDTLYIGGGTPSLWAEKGGEFLSTFFKKNSISFNPDYEATLEVNPGGWTEKGIESFKNFGINRFSIGFQSFDPYFLKVLDRVHDVEEAMRTFDYFQKAKDNFSVDFMLGLPFSETAKRDVVEELKKVLDYEPNHLSLYILTTKDNYIHKSSLPSEEWLEEEYLKVSDYLNSQGFDHYEVSNFSKPGLQSKHNLKYWRAESVAAVGPSATGFLKEIKTRFKWKIKSDDYQSEILTEEEMKLEDLYLRMRINEPFNFLPFFKEENHQKILELIKTWSHSGLVVCANSQLSLTPKGFLVMDNLLDQFFTIENQ